MAALRAHVVEKEGGLGLARDENVRLKDGLGMYQKEVERLSSENRILKRAVGIQNSKGKEVRGSKGLWGTAVYLAAPAQNSSRIRVTAA